MEKPVEYTVRNYVKGDEVALARIFRECFGPKTPRLLKESFRRHRVRPEDVFVGVADGKLVSSVEVLFKDLHHGEGLYLKTAGISDVCTDSDYRRKGILTHLMKLSLDYARQNGASNTSLYTGLDIPAHRIYQRLGFVDIMTFRSFRKYIDFAFVFARWLRQISRSLKDDRVAAGKLEGWEKSVAMELKEVGALSFRLRRSSFQRLKKPPKRADIEFSTDLQTFTNIMRGVVQWEDAVKEGKLSVKRGEPADIEMLNRILNWRWSE